MSIMRINERSEVPFFPYAKDKAFLRGLRTLLVPNIGILASIDVVDIDKALLDLIAQSKPVGKFANVNSPDILGKINGTDSLIQIRTTQELGLGNMAYQLKEQK